MMMAFRSCSGRVMAELVMVSEQPLPTAAMTSASKTRRMLHDHDSYHIAAGSGATQGSDFGRTGLDMPAHSDEAAFGGSRTSPSGLFAEERGPTVVGDEQRSGDPGLGDSMRILHERYARGEISREEYLRAREDMMTLAR